MAESSEWSAAQQQGSNPTQEPQVAPSTELFDGDLLPDDLIAIYNEAVGDGGTSEGHHNEEIPTLGPQPGTTASEGTKDAEKVVDHPGARVAETAARLDDGIGVFQSASSYNDLTTLLTPSSKSSGNEAPKVHLQTTTAAATAGQPTVANAVTIDPPPIAATHTAVTAHPPGVASTVAGKRKGPELASGVKKAAAIAPATHGTSNPTPVYPGAGAAPSVQPPTAPVKSSTAIQPQPAPVASVPKGSAPRAPTPASAPSNPSAALSKKPTGGSSRPKSQKPSMVPEPSVSGAKANPPKAATEADFKTVAQAAISSLILSTKNGEVASVKSESGGQGVNTSTAHIKALTGSNWVAACSGAGAATVAADGQAGMANDAKANNRSKRQNLTADERARQNRDRNREHARNTRLRKKAYVEELKRTLTELVAQRDKAELEKRQAAQREVEQREVRFRVIEEFLKLRGRNESNYASWAAILDSNFSLIMPGTDFGAMVNGGTRVEVSDGAAKLEKVFSGVHEAMNESNCFSLFLQSLMRGRTGASQYAPVEFVYNCDGNNFFMDDSHAVLDWSAGTVGLTKRGVPSDLSIRGSVRASFCPASNKLLSANFMFDTGAVLSQLQEFMTIPSTAYEAESQAASHRADALLDSLQMPRIDKPTIVPQGESSDEGP